MQTSPPSRSPLRSLLWLASLALVAILFVASRGTAAPTPDGGASADVPRKHVPALQREAACNASTEAVTPATAQQLYDLPLNELLVRLEKPPFVSPPTGEAPTMVDIDLHVSEITDIDAATNTFSMEGYLALVWCDPREQFDPATTGVQKEIFLEKDAEKELEYIWWPDFYFVNEVTARTIENEELLIYPNGTIEYREKFGVALATEYDMRPFPFDSQVLEVEIESFAWSNKELTFHLHDQVFQFASDFQIPEWRMTGMVGHIEDKEEFRDQEAFSELVAEITVQRDPGFYLTKIMLPLGIIVTISWSVFWMIGDTLADRMSVSFTGVLTSVAYQFIVSESLPRHVYNTYLDAFVLLSFVMMVLTIMENIAVNALSLNGNDATATAVDRVSRLAFPMVYIGSLAALYVIYVP